MSLKNAHAYKNGILLKDAEKFSLLVPIQITLSENFKKEVKIQEKINRSLFYFLTQNTNRYSIIFDRDSNNNPKMIFYLYFSDNEKTKLFENAQSAMTHLNKFLMDLNLKIIFLNAEKILQEILSRLTTSIIEIAPKIYQVKIKNGMTYLFVIKLFFEHDQEKNDFTAFLKDFYKISKQGFTSIDIINQKYKKQSETKVMSSITITIFENNLDIIKNALKRMLSLLQIFGSHLS